MGGSLSFYGNLFENKDMDACGGGFSGGYYARGFLKR